MFHLARQKKMGMTLLFIPKIKLIVTLSLSKRKQAKHIIPTSTGSV